MALTLDGYATGSSHSTTAAAALTTSNADDIIVVFAASETNSSTYASVSSISDTAGLTWYKRSRTESGYDGNHGMEAEVWWAYAPSPLSANLITVTMSQSCDNLGITVFGVSGADTSSPWDTSVALPGYTLFNQSGTTESVRGLISTLNANCMLLAFAGGENNIGSGVMSSPWTNIANEWTNYDANSVGTSAFYQVVSAQQSNLVANTSWNPSGVNGGIFITDAIVEATPSPGAASLAIDGLSQFPTTGVGSASYVGYLSTANADDVVIVVVGYSNATSITGISDTAGLSWSKIATKINGGGATDVWYAKAVAVLANDEITVALNETGYNASFVAFGVANANASSPIDSDSPFTASGNGNAVISSINTAATDTLFFIAAWSNNGNDPFTWSGLTDLGSCNSGGGNDSTSFGLSFTPFSATQSGYSTGNSAQSVNDWSAVGFAIAGKPPPPSGTWESTGAPDTFAASGFETGPPVGTWESTGATDTFSASGTVPPPPLQLDGYATAGISEVSGDGYAAITTGTVTLSTTTGNDVIVLAIAAGGFYAASQITSVADMAGLTWKRRNRAWQNGGNKSAEAANYDSGLVNQGLDIEIWWAHAPAALSGDVISVNCTEGNGSMSLLAFGVSGANYAAPWDSNSQAGGFVDKIGNNAFSPAMAQLSTNSTKSFLFGIHGDSAADAGLTQSPFTYVTSASGSEHNGDGTFTSLIYEIVSAPQSGTNLLFGAPYGGGYAYSAASVMFDSLVAFGETGTTDEIYWQWDAASISGTLSLTTTNELILNYSPANYNVMVLIQVLIQSASGDGEVTSITEGGGALLSPGFQRRSRVVGGAIATEIWWGWMPTDRPSNDTITINTTGTASGDVVSAQMWGLVGSTGAYGLGDPFWDGSPSLPAENSASGDSPPPNAIDISTETPSCLAVAWTANITEPEGGYTEPFITLVQAPPNTVAPVMSFQSGGPLAYMGFEYLYSGNASLLANETAEFLTSPEPTGWLMLADAIPVGPPQPPTGAWASTEGADEFTHSGNYGDIGIVGDGGWVGFLPIPGTWHSTESADKFTGAPEQAPYLGEGWLGWVPAFCAWASTEKADVMGFYGWLIGSGKITGQLGTKESPDRLAFSDYSAVSGTWGSVESKDRMAAAGILTPLTSVRPPVPVKRRLLIIT